MFYADGIGHYFRPIHFVNVCFERILKI